MRKSAKVMEELLKRELGTSKLVPFGAGGGGCISSGTGYNTDNGQIFVKVNNKDGAKTMFEGEFASLEAIEATNTVRVPKPIKVLEHPDGGSIIVMEYLDLHGLSKYAGQLGQDVARMHLHNEELRKKEQKKESSVHKVDAEGISGGYVDKFGFQVTTCCGFIPQDNSWTDDWPTCFTKRLKLQLDLIEKDYGDREASSLSQALYPIIPRFFDGIEVVPSLLHGDLWGGNAAQISGSPVVFDPASFYGHHEYELAIAQMFGGFSRAFFSEYHSLVPKAPGHSRRLELYKLFHYLNHWNHFGTGYRGQSISIMKSLVK